MFDDDYDEENYRDQPVNPADKWCVAASTVLLALFVVYNLFN